MPLAGKTGRKSAFLYIGTYALPVLARLMPRRMRGRNPAPGHGPELMKRGRGRLDPGPPGCLSWMDGCSNLFRAKVPRIRVLCSLSGPVPPRHGQGRTASRASGRPRWLQVHPRGRHARSIRYDVNVQCRVVLGYVCVHTYMGLSCRYRRRLASEHHQKHPEGVCLDGCHQGPRPETNPPPLRERAELLIGPFTHQGNSPWEKLKKRPRSSDG